MDHIGLVDPQTLMFSKLFSANMNILRAYWPFKMIILSNIMKSGKHMKNKCKNFYVFETYNLIINLCQNYTLLVKNDTYVKFYTVC